MKTHLANNIQVVLFKYEGLLLKPLESEIANPFPVRRELSRFVFRRIHLNCKENQHVCKNTER